LDGRRRFEAAAAQHEEAEWNQHDIDQQHHNLPPAVAEQAEAHDVDPAPDPHPPPNLIPQQLIHMELLRLCLLRMLQSVKQGRVKRSFYGVKLKGYVHYMAQSAKHRQQQTRSKQITKRPARKTLAAC
jgi:hypothetical protein